MRTNQQSTTKLTYRVIPVYLLPNIVGGGIAISFKAPFNQHNSWHLLLKSYVQVSTIQKHPANQKANYNTSNQSWAVYYLAQSIQSDSLLQRYQPIINCLAHPRQHLPSPCRAPSARSQGRWSGHVCWAAPSPRPAACTAPAAAAASWVSRTAASRASVSPRWGRDAWTCQTSPGASHPRHQTAAGGSGTSCNTHKYVSYLTETCVPDPFRKRRNRIRIVCITTL